MSFGKIKVLFLCIGNSCRSQMAEGFGKKYLGESFDFYSAGTSPEEIKPITIEVMKEKGIDISKQYSKNVSELLEIDFDYVITLCDDLSENCPVFPKKVKVIHRGFKDPAKAKGEREEVLKVYRNVMDEIEDFILNLPEILK